jgi:hypothetical protein
MTSHLTPVRPNCEKILKLKNSWALSEREFNFQNESMEIFDSEKNNSNYTIYSFLKSRFKLFEKDGLKNSFLHSMKIS